MFLMHVLQYFRVFDYIVKIKTFFIEKEKKSSITKEILDLRAPTYIHMTKKNLKFRWQGSKLLLFATIVTGFIIRTP